MKTLFKVLIFSSLIFAYYGCSAAAYEQDKAVLFSGYDFSKYYQRGFLFTPEQYLGDYESIGLLTVEILPEVKRVDDDRPKSGYIITSSKATMKPWAYSVAGADEVLEEFYKKAKAMGADAVVRLNFESKMYNNGEINYFSTSASGYAIKRK